MLSKCCYNISFDFIIVSLVFKLIGLYFMVITGNINSICLIFLGLKGDLLLRTPIIETIKIKFPKVKITVVVDEGNQDIMENNPDIHNVLTVNRNKKNRFRHIKNMLTHILELRRKKFDVMINFYGGGSTSLIIFLVQAKYRIAFTHQKRAKYANNILIDPPKIPDGHSVAYISHLLTPLGIDPYSVRKGASFYLSDSEKYHAEKKLERYSEDNIIAINLGAGAANKCWPVPFFIELSKQLHSKYKMIPLVFTNPGMENLTEDYLSGINGVIPVIKMPLSSFRRDAAIMEKCNVVVTGDTSLMHLSIALHKPTIAIFLNTEPKHVSPDEDWFIACDLRNNKSESGIDMVMQAFHQLKNLIH